MKTYNGWENYETWCVNLWLNENEYSQKWLQTNIEEAANIQDAGEQIREHLVEQARETVGEANLFNDLLLRSLNRVAWVQIVENNDERTAR